MTPLAEHQFEILADETATEGVVFGIGAPISLDEEGFDPGETEWLTQDGQNGRRGTAAFGRDVLAGRTWSWETHTDQQDVASAVAAMEALDAAWTPEDVAQNPGSLSVIRYRLAGRTRRVYGRPRRFVAPPSNLILSGFIPMSHDFKCVDPYTYDDEESVAQLPYVAGATGGGVTLPAVMPLRMASNEGTGVGQVEIGGTKRAYPVIRFQGPWIDPSLTTDDWTVRWKGSIPANGWVEIDTRPWRLTVTNQAGASVFGTFDRRTALEDIWFAPGKKAQISLGGSAPGGSALATVRWRNAHKGY